MRTNIIIIAIALAIVIIVTITITVTKSTVLLKETLRNQVVLATPAR